MSETVTPEGATVTSGLAAPVSLKRTWSPLPKTVVVVALAWSAQSAPVSAQAPLLAVPVQVRMREMSTLAVRMRLSPLGAMVADWRASGARRAPATVSCEPASVAMLPRLYVPVCRESMLMVVVAPGSRVSGAATWRVLA